MAEFLVELYVSRVDADGAEREAQRARRAAAALTAEGQPVRLVRSIFVPEDETCFLLVEADTAEAVHETAMRAAVRFERVLATADRANDPPDAERALRPGAATVHPRATRPTKENEMSTAQALTPDLGAVKQRQQQMWASGDFHAVATLIQPVADQLVDAVDPQADWRVLDVATGSGNAAMAAARCGCDVVGIDYVPALLERGRRRVEAEGLELELIEGDAESIPFGDSSFDAVLSVFGSMFAPDQAAAARELARVCRPGGRIGLATWTPDGFIGEMLRTVAAHVPPPTGLASPILWGGEDHVRSLFGETVAALEATERTFTFRFRSADAFVDYFRAYYGPTLKAFEAVGADGEAGLHADLASLVARHAGTEKGSVSIRATWLETVITRSEAPVAG